jgi:hypothetical protein
MPVCNEYFNVYILKSNGKAYTGLICNFNANRHETYTTARCRIFSPHTPHPLPVNYTSNEEGQFLSQK